MSGERPDHQARRRLAEWLEQHPEVRPERAMLFGSPVTVLQERGVLIVVGELQEPAGSRAE